MKLSMSSLDIMVCARELKNAIDFRVDNVYELDGTILIRLRGRRGERQDLAMELGRRVNLTEREYKVPKHPSPFAMLLRKHLVNSRLCGVEQPDLERILELRFCGKEKRLLILELFSRGNLILCDHARKILQPYRPEVWRHRIIRSGEIYRYPPKKVSDPKNIEGPLLRRVLTGAPDVVRGLATGMGMGGQLAEEICARSAIQKNRKPSDLSDQELDAIARSIKEMLEQEPDPCIVYAGKKPVDVLPFDFKIHIGRPVKRFSSFNDALDEYFSTLAVISASERIKKRLDGELEKLRRRQKKQQADFAEMYAKSAELKRKADLLAMYHPVVDELLSRLNRVREKKRWQEASALVQEARQRKEHWIAPLRRVDPKRAEIEIELAGERIVLDLRASAFENASRFYGLYKKLAEKSARGKAALERTAKEIEKLSSVGIPEDEISPPKKRRKPRWFERYRWFISSDGMLVIAGRDAKTNAEVVEKHMEPNDRHLHADIAGAPHVVVKSGNREVPETTLREAAEFAAMHSKAWREGLGNLDVYWVMPNQISKRAPSGTYLPKGSYVIKGKRNFIKVPLRGAVGVLMLNGEEFVTCGPVSAMQKHSRMTVEVVPGKTKKSELARKIQSKFKSAGMEISISEVERALPPGPGKIVS